MRTILSELEQTELGLLEWMSKEPAGADPQDWSGNLIGTQKFNQVNSEYLFDNLWLLVSHQAWKWHNTYFLAIGVHAAGIFVDFVTTVKFKQKIWTLLIRFWSVGVWCGSELNTLEKQNFALYRRKLFLGMEQSYLEQSFLQSSPNQVEEGQSVKLI